MPSATRTPCRHIRYPSDVVIIYGHRLNPADVRHLDFPQDWVHVENLVDAIGCAARALRANPGAVGGRPYFINDGEPVITR